MLRRTLLTGIAAAAIPVLLVSCTGSTSADQFAMAKAYLDAGVGAVLAGSQAFLAGPPLPSAATAQAVIGMMASLEAAKAAIDKTSSVTDWKSGAIEALAVMQQLSPLVAPFLGLAAPYVPLAIAVVTAFTQALQPPPAAPPVPPAALTRKAAQYHRNRPE